LAVSEAQRYTSTTLGNPECASADLKGSLIPDVLRCGACGTLRRFRRNMPQYTAAYRNMPHKARQRKTTRGAARYRTHVGTATQRNEMYRVQC